MESHPRGGCHLSQDVVSEQRDAIVVRLSHFPGPVSIRPESLPAILHAACDRHHGNVEEVSDAGSLKMCMGESDYCRIAVMVAGAPVPLLRDAGRSELYKSERNARAHENVSVAAASDLGVNIAGVVNCSRAGECGGYQGCVCRKFQVHFSFSVWFFNILSINRFLDFAHSASLEMTGRTQSTSLEMTGYFRIFVFFVKSMISGM